MPSSTASMGQGSRLLKVLSGLTEEQMRNILGNEDILLLLGEATDLSKVDRDVLRAALNPPKPPVPWTAVSDYYDLIVARAELRGWKLPKKQLDALKTQLENLDHAGPLLPVGISMWLGQDLAFNRAEAIAWLKDVVEAKGLTFVDYTGEGRTSFYQGSEQSGNKQVSACDLDLSTYWNPTNGIVPNEVRDQLKGQRLPGLEVLWLMALNPEAYLAIDFENIPGLLAPGLVVDSGRLPCLGRNEREAWVYGGWADGGWSSGSAVVFRELQH